MKINFIVVGKIKEKFLKDAIEEYSKRLKKFCTLNIIELDDCTSKIESKDSIEKSLEKEADLILSRIKSGYIVALDIKGEEFSTEELHKKIKKIMLDGYSEISFIIGGSYGLSDRVKKITNLKLSFSKLTFPHQLFRVILLEQIYRVFKIENNEPYHK